MKSYLKAKDIQEMLGISKNKAYEMLKNAMETPVKVNGKKIPYKDTVEAKTVGGLNIPSKMFKRLFPNYIEGEADEK